MHHALRAEEVLYISLDLEVTGAQRCLHSICSLGAKAFAATPPLADGKEWLEARLDLAAEHKWYELFKPGNMPGCNLPAVWDKGLAGTGTHGLTTEHVGAAANFAERWGELTAWMSAAMLSEGCESVCVVAHNGKGVDFDWICTELARAELDWPSFVKYGWDTLSHARALSKFKKKKGSDEPAKMGNHGCGIKELLKVLCGVDMGETHHQADYDADAGGQVAAHKGLWEVRLNASGILSFPAYIESKRAKCKEAALGPLPNLSGSGWEYVKDDQSPSKAPQASGVHWGPKGDLKSPPDTLADYFFNFVTIETLELVAKWTNYYAAEQHVTKTADGAFKIAKSTDAGARHRCGQSNSDWGQITKWHVPAAFAVLLRGAANRYKTPLTAWQQYDTLGDPEIRARVGIKQFKWIMRWITFADYENLSTYTDKDGKVHMEKDAKVRPFLDELEKAFQKCWDMSQYGTVDESTCKCKSKWLIRVWAP